MKIGAVEINLCKLQVWRQNTLLQAEHWVNRCVTLHEWLNLAATHLKLDLDFDLLLLFQRSMVMS